MASSANKGDFTKLDPRLRAFVSRPQILALLRRAETPPAADTVKRKKVRAARTRALPARSKARASLLHGIAFPDPNDQAKKSPLAEVFIKLADAGAKLPASVEVHSRIGDVVTAVVPLDAIAALTASSDVHFIELTRPAHTMAGGVGLDGAAEVGATLLQAKGAGAEELDGSGVVVGMVDSGIDIYHPTFIDIDQQGVERTRIEAIWAQTMRRRASEQSPAAWPYGVEYSRADIESDFKSGHPHSVVRHRDNRDDHHGTTTASLACGNGRSAPGSAVTPRQGVAPKATIAVVATVETSSRPLGDLKRVADGIAYLFERAGKRPCVVNVSMGDGLGPHDGTTLVERAIDQLTRAKNRAVVVAAGNSNNIKKHTAGTVSRRSKFQSDFTVPGVQNDGETIQIWYEGKHGLDVCLRAPGSQSTPIVKAGTGTHKKPIVLGNTVVVITSVLDDRRNGKNVIEIMISPAAASSMVDEGIWQITLINRNEHGIRFDAWIAQDIDPTWGVNFADAIEDDCTLTTPSTAAGALTVGAHRARTGGGTEIWPDSGWGPTRSGLRKPDIVAPGVNLGAAYVHGQYKLSEGTSVATALASGCVALVLQYAALSGTRLTVRKVGGVLARLAFAAGPDRIPNESFGHGCIWIHRLDEVTL
jgi:subtilisin family serine protease